MFRWWRRDSRRRVRRRSGLDLRRPGHIIDIIAHPRRASGRRHHRRHGGRDPAAARSGSLLRPAASLRPQEVHCVRRRSRRRGAVGGRHVSAGPGGVSFGLGGDGRWWSRTSAARRGDAAAVDDGRKREDSVKRNTLQQRRHLRRRWGTSLGALLANFYYNFLWFLNPR